MTKADIEKVKVVRDDALIVAVDIGMEMNQGYCTTQTGGGRSLIPRAVRLPAVFTRHCDFHQMMYAAATSRTRHRHLHRTTARQRLQRSSLPPLE
jgi:hypothetical protein